MNREKECSREAMNELQSKWDPKAVSEIAVSGPY